MRKTKEKNICAECSYHSCTNICIWDKEKYSCDGQCKLHHNQFSCQHNACKNYVKDKYFKEMAELMEELTD